MSLLRYFARTNPGPSILIVACLLLAGALDALGLSTLLPVLNMALAEPGASASEGFQRHVLALFDAVGVPRRLGPLVALLCGVFWLRAGILLLANRSVGNAVARVATDLRLRLLRALLEARWSYFTQLPVGRASNAIAAEASRGAKAYLHLSQVITLGVQAAISLLVASAVSWPATLVATAAGLVSLGMLQFLVRMSGRGGQRQTVFMRSLSARLADVLQAMKLFKATGRGGLVAPLLEHDTERLDRALRKRVLGREGLRAMQDPILITMAAGGLLLLRATMGLGAIEAGFLILLCYRTLNNVNGAQRKYQNMVAEESALWSMMETIEEAEAHAEESGGSRSSHLESRIVLADLAVHYEGRPALAGVSLEIPAGEITALVGPSGGGKTTLVDVLTGLVQPAAGAVTVDGMPLAELELEEWRRGIGYVPQETLLLNDSLRRNVSLGSPDVTDADVERALRDAGAWEHVAGLPEGLDTPLGERGMRLSGGQRQRVAIARALVHRPRLLILDEATAGLDPATEKSVWATLAKLRGRTTIVAVSHQPALLDTTDRVYRIEGGTAFRVEAEEPPPPRPGGALPIRDGRLGTQDR